MVEKGGVAQGMSPGRLVTIVCTAQVLAQIGAYFWPVFLPGLTDLWALTYTEAGWVTSVFYGAYVLSVPVLVTLTDRIDARRIYLVGVGLTVTGHLYFGLAADGFWSAMLGRTLAGIGWAGTYMTGLKLLADRVDDKLMSRAVAAHAAGVGISGAISFVTGDLIAQLAGWQMAFIVAGTTAAVAWGMVAIAVPGRPAPAQAAADGGKLFDFRPVFRNRSAMAYAIAYCVHTFEMNAIRGWAVAFLVYVAATTGSSAPVSAAFVATSLALLGTLASVGGNEVSIRLGRRKLIHAAMLGSVAIAAAIAFVGTTSYAVAGVLLVLYGIVIWLDSSSLTAGTAGTADPARRGATLAVHSMLGYAGGFVGPLAVGWVLDLYGGMSPAAWAAAFLMIAALMLGALVTFWLMRPRELQGDRAAGERRSA